MSVSCEKRLFPPHNSEIMLTMEQRWLETSVQMHQDSIRTHSCEVSPGKAESYPYLCACSNSNKAAQGFFDILFLLSQPQKKNACF